MRADAPWSNHIMVQPWSNGYSTAHLRSGARIGDAARKDWGVHAAVDARAGDGVQRLRPVQGTVAGTQRPAETEETWTAASTPLRTPARHTHGAGCRAAGLHPAPRYTRRYTQPHLEACVAVRARVAHVPTGLMRVARAPADGDGNAEPLTADPRRPCTRGVIRARASPLHPRCTLSP
jgi:hypothetical protein